MLSTLFPLILIVNNLSFYSWNKIGRQLELGKIQPYDMKWIFLSFSFSFLFLMPISGLAWNCVGFVFMSIIYTLYNGRNYRVRETQKLLAYCNLLGFVQSSSGSALAVAVEKCYQILIYLKSFNSTSFDYWLCFPFV